MVRQGILRVLLLLLACSPAYGFPDASRSAVRSIYDVEAEVCVKSVGDQQIAACTRVIESGRWRGADVAWAYYYRASANEQKGEFEDAIADYSRAIGLDPDNARWYTSRSNTKEQKGDFGGALADANRAIGLDPASTYAYVIRGNARYGRGDIDGAINDYSRAIKLDPKNDYAYLRRGLAMGNKGKVDAAITDFGQAIDANPRNASAYAGRAIEEEKKGHYSSAFADFDRAIEVDPRNALAYVGRATAKLTRGDLEGSLADDDRAIELAPRYSVAYRERGKAFFFKGELDRAARDLIRAQDQKSDAYAAIWLYLVRANAKMEGRKELADNAAKLDRTRWPASIIAFYLGKGTPASLLDAAKHPDPRIMKQQVCEARFYLAEWQLLRNDRIDALQLFQTAAEQCPLGFIERDDAIMELKRLSRSPVVPSTCPTPDC